MKNQEIKVFSQGCRLNALESEKIRAMLAAADVKSAIIINTCAVTNEALRQSRQQFHKIVRENPNIPVFITGCGATMKPDDFGATNVTVIPNDQKFNPAAYGINTPDSDFKITHFEKMQKKGFVQIGDGCDHHCTYCITRVLRGRAVHFLYNQILNDARALLNNGYEEIILTGVNIADWKGERDTENLLWLCKKLLSDLPEMKHLTLSSLDPASNIEGIIDLIHENPRMSRHLHLSVQSGCDIILAKMARRHTGARIRDIMKYAGQDITFSWDIICGFPGETDELFSETFNLANELKPIKIHAFPFSARPDTPAADMPNQVARAISKERVRKLSDI
jgi:threonylcarbamoyladenosine tRNA methylthiotransferase MtaB